MAAKDEIGTSIGLFGQRDHWLESLLSRRKALVVVYLSLAFPAGLLLLAVAGIQMVSDAVFNLSLFLFIVVVGPCHRRLDDDASIRARRLERAWSIIWYGGVPLWGIWVITGFF